MKETGVVLFLDEGDEAGGRWGRSDAFADENVGEEGTVGQYFKVIRVVSHAVVKFLDQYHRLSYLR